uniref:common pilus major fimbrillin subunit EcpA n=1 Tax=Klebsiella sp. TaxID=576 RepID=UPI00338DBA47
MIDTAAGILGDNISAQSGCYNHFDRTSAEYSLTFCIKGTLTILRKSLTTGMIS